MLAAHPALAQGRWTWPDLAQNLQVLPSDTSGEELGTVMRGFTRALGVRCAPCHVGEEGQPLSTFDFLSDDKPAKRTGEPAIACYRRAVARDPRNASAAERLRELEGREEPAAPAEGD